ncbi:uncharacterized protein [Scyliorhinus torazame]|uniref:uncharacterized protein n=1 Tax=Scyliorhinus torazame TaxID=75743 RepID=UPI003B5BCC62
MLCLSTRSAQLERGYTLMLSLPTHPEPLLSAKELTGALAAKELTGALAAKELTGALAAKELTGALAAKELTGALAAKELTGDLAAKELTGALAAKELTGALAAKELTGALAAKELTGALAAKELTGALAAKELTGDLAAKELTGAFAAKELTGALAAKELTGALAAKVNWGLSKLCLIKTASVCNRGDGVVIDGRVYSREEIRLPWWRGSCEACGGGGYNGSEVKEFGCVDDAGIGLTEASNVSNPRKGEEPPWEVVILSMFYDGHRGSCSVTGK